MSEQEQTSADETADDVEESADANVTDETATEPAAAESEVDLEALVAENPEEVARLLERLDLVNDLLDTADLATAAMDDRMVQELTGTASNLGAAADGLATEDAAALGEATGANAGELAEAVEGVAQLQRSGTLDDLLELADAISLASAAMDDEMVMNLASTGGRLGELADTAADDDVAGSLDAMLAALGEAGQEEPSEVGMLGLVGALRDPEVKRGMGYLIAVAGALGRNLDR
jgi:uncharacterized protein YjgD (DUF1641 family)